MGDVVERLLAAGCVAAEEEGAELVGAAPDEKTLEAWLRRREQGEPLPWIIGTTQFCGHTLRVERGVYVPRYQSEELAHRAAALLPSDGAALDLCTGSGAIAIHLKSAAPAATVVGVEIDAWAAACARRNGVSVVVGDLDEPLLPTMFDVVTAVAPYVPSRRLGLLPADVQRFEPRRALDGGADGLDLLCRIVTAAAARLLKPGGWLLVEIGAEQDELLRPTLSELGYDPVTTWFDDDGDLRGLAAQVTGSLRGDFSPCGR